MNKNSLLVVIGKNLRLMRKEAGYPSQEVFAYAAGFGRSYYGRIERGEQNISMLVLGKLCLALKCNPACIVPEYKDIKRLINRTSEVRQK